MNRRNFIQQSTLSALALALFKSDAFAGRGNFQNFKFETLRNNIGFFTEQGGTIGWFNSPDGFLVIDAQFPNSAPHVIAELKKLGDKPFKFLLNTHHHGDHTAGNIAFKGLTEHVVAHKNSLENQRKAAEKANNLSNQLLPDTTFEKDWNVKLGKEKISGHYFGAGHTNGDVIYHFENANIVHTGDLVFNRRYPYIDLENGANIGNWIVVLEQIQKKFDKDTIFIFGHSLEPYKITGNKDDVKAFQHYLQSLLSFVSKEIKAGKSKEEILKTTQIPGVSEWSGDGIQRSLTAAYTELTRV
ncbi:MBL fold metallo-hydrolase [Pedobacter montanisoli]|uniref:MBL fold metallo-hydrolase n=1 Tax=Pedobacter montanisoli TaxID=2923277 RepID=A0ABS9ZZZ3_9SPHI|nr:MBL fold metallo-hydrolase [Pedobacter montanisoli]MCJ0743891.1 MBL fold metallo-hydrolase [Pedobacter montanisoli]